MFGGDPGVPGPASNNTGEVSVLRRNAYVLGAKLLRQAWQRRHPTDVGLGSIELLASAGLAMTYPEHFRSSTVIYSIDNQPVAASLCKGASRSADLQALTTACHALALKLGSRVYFE